MSEFVGVVSIGAFRVTPEYLNWIGTPICHGESSLIAHRIGASESVGLGFAGQPGSREGIATSEAGNMLVLSGRVGDRDLLQQALVAQGVRISEHIRDAELILRGFEKLGPEIFAHLEGTYALAVWHHNTRSITLARSPASPTAVFYRFEDGKLTFSSHASACTGQPDSRVRFREKELFNFLTFGATFATKTLYEGVSKLEPGSWHRMSPDGDFSTGRFWPLADIIAERRTQGSEKLSQRSLRRVRQALRDCGEANERLAVILDGGMASSALGLKRYCPAKIATYSVLLGPLEKSEIQTVNAVGARLKAQGIPHQVVLLDPKTFRDHLTHLCEMQDEPIIRPSDALLYAGALAAKGHRADRVISAVGANGVFMRLLRWADLAKRSRAHERKSTTWLREVSVGVARLTGKAMGETVEQMERSLNGQPFYWGYREMFTRDEKLSLLSPRLRHECNELSSWDEIAPLWGRFERQFKETAIEDWMPFLEVAQGLPEGLGRRHELAVSGAGMSLHAPFLSPQLVADVMALHAETRDIEDLPRTTFEQIFAHLLPDTDLASGAYRLGGQPLAESFMSSRGFSAPTLFEDFHRQTDLLDRRAVLDLFETASPDQKWILLNFIVWWKAQFAFV